MDPDRAADGHAVVGGTACQISRISARNQRLSRGAAGIDAGAAEKLALDDGSLPAGGHQSPRQARSGLSGADNDRIMVRHNPPLISRLSSREAGIPSIGGRRRPVAHNSVHNSAMLLGSEMPFP